LIIFIFRYILFVSFFQTFGIEFFQHQLFQNMQKKISNMHMINSWKTLSNKQLLLRSGLLSYLAYQYTPFYKSKEYISRRKKNFFYICTLLYFFKDMFLIFDTIKAPKTIKEAIEKATKNSVSGKFFFKRI
jgi:hypothetical protein